MGKDEKKEEKKEEKNAKKEEKKEEKKAKKEEKKEEKKAKKEEKKEEKQEEKKKAIARPRWKDVRKALTKKGLAAATPKLAPIPADKNAGKIKDGKCNDFQEGASGRSLGEFNSFFKKVTQEQCFQNCDNDGACEQAHYNSGDEECHLGVNAVTSAEATDSFTCYAKNGFGHQLGLNVKEGFCGDFQEGWGGDAPSQCDLRSTSENSQKECSHWGAEYGLSERGCWAKCKENSACTQAVYEDKQGSWSCLIGTKAMTGSPGPSRCSDCNNKCFAPTAFVTKAIATATAKGKDGDKGKETDGDKGKESKNKEEKEADKKVEKKKEKKAEKKKKKEEK